MPRGYKNSPCIAKIIIVLMVSILQISKAESQSLQEHLIGQASGLDNVNVMGTAVTHDGYILAATQDGLYAYNGKRSIVLDNHPNNIDRHESLLGLQVAYGQIMAFSHDGLYTAADPGNIPDNLHLQAVAAPGGHRIVEATISLNKIMATDGHGFMVLQSTTGTLEPFALANKTLKLQSDEKITHLTGSPHGGIWFTTSRKKLCLFDGRNTSCNILKDPDGDYGQITIGPQNHAFVRSLTTLHEADEKNESVVSTTLPDQDGSELDYIYFMSAVTAPNGDIVTQSSHGLAVRHNGAWYVQYLNTDTIKTSISFTPQGMLWIGTLTRGLLLINGYGSIENYTRSSGLSSSTAWTITETQNGDIWIATDGGIDKVTAGTKNPVHTLDLHATYINTLDGNTVITTQRSGRFCTFLGNTTHCIGEKDERISAALTAKDGQSALIASDGEILTVPITKGRPEEPHPLAKIEHVTDMAYGPDGKTWIMADYQLSLLGADGKIQKIKTPMTEDFQGFVILAASPNDVWVGGILGVYRFIMNPMTHKVEKETLYDKQLVSPNITALMKDQKNRIWVGTTAGISILDRKKWRAFTQDDGLVWNDINQQSMLAARDGSIWIGTSGGVTHVLSPESIISAPPPNTVINRIHMGTHSLSDDIPNDAGELEAILGSPGYTDPERVRFQFRIPDIDIHHPHTSIDGRMAYPYIPPGPHTLEVTAFDPQAHRIGNTVSISFKVSPPWYLTNIMMIMYAFGGTALISSMMWGITQFRERSRKARIIEMQKQIDEGRQDLHLSNEKLKLAYERLETQARTDGLTGLLNRFTIENTVRRAIEDHDPKTTILSILIFDLDHFKKINDTHGHVAGDTVLSTIAGRLKISAGPDEICGRYGGEEFLIMLPMTIENAHRRSIELISDATSEPVDIDGARLKITCSAGITSARPEDNWNSLIERADNALYDAKKSGRNQTKVA